MTVGLLGILMFYILQWNAQSLVANRQDLKRFLDAFKENLTLICIQETELKPALNFVIPGYVGFRKNRNILRGGCAVFIREGI